MPVDDLTKLGIRISILASQVEMALSHCDRIQYTMEESVAAQDARITAIEKKLDTLGKVVHRLAKAQGLLAYKTCEQ